MQAVHLEPLLQALGWSQQDLDPSYPPAVGYGGTLHQVLVVRDLRRLRTLYYDSQGRHALCREHEWIAVRLTACVAPGIW